MKAFVVRPFGVKGGIDFEDVHNKLIGPALAAVDVQGGTTAPFMQAGNIREDMFQQLLVADVVIADISIHNANVFYELGIRHALQPNRTMLLRARSLKEAKDRGPEDDVPFDLKTDRYLEYDSTKPAEYLERLTDALRQTLANDKVDSPVFMMLPNLEGQDRGRFQAVPQSFRDNVQLAQKAGQFGLLGLLAMEAQDFPWASEGLRVVGRAQFDLGADPDAQKTWEALLSWDPLDAEANQKLGTIYQRIGELDKSDQALQRVASGKRVSRKDRCEALSLMGRNIKAKWKTAWRPQAPEKMASTALLSPELNRAFELYLQAFQDNMESAYPGLNALGLLTIRLELAKRFPEIWEIQFDKELQAQVALDALETQRQRLAGAVYVSLEAKREELQRYGKEDHWALISAADYQFLTSTRPKRVAFEYRSALEGAPEFSVNSARGQLEIFRDLGVLPENTAAALAEFPPASARAATGRPGRVILFTGHMVDPPGFQPARFPDSLKDRVRAAIKEKLEQELERTVGSVVAIGVGACGGDLLFHDACEELKIEHRLLLPLPPDRFRNDSVSPAGRFWEDSFDRLLKKQTNVQCLAKTTDLPLWLTVKKGYTSWQRANLWLIQEALAVNAQNFTLLALWDGAKTDGIGGVYHMRSVAEENGAALNTIYIAELAKAAGTGAGN